MAQRRPNNLRDSDGKEQRCQVRAMDKSEGQESDVSSGDHGGEQIVDAVGTLLGVACGAACWDGDEAWLLPSREQLKTHFLAILRPCRRSSRAAAPQTKLLSI